MRHYSSLKIQDLSVPKNISSRKIILLYGKENLRLTVADEAITRRSLAISVLLTSACFAASAWVLLTLFEGHSPWMFGLALGLCSLVTGICASGIFTLMHDAGHGALFRSERLNDTVGRILGFFLLLNYECWKSTHLLHHKFNQSIGKDPKYPAESIQFVLFMCQQLSRRMQRLLSPKWLRPLAVPLVAVQLVLMEYTFWSFHSPITFPSLFVKDQGRTLRQNMLPGQLKKSLIYYIAQLSLLGLIYLWGLPSTIWYLWLGTVAVAFACIVPVFLTHINHDSINFVIGNYDYEASLWNIRDVDSGRLLNWFSHDFSVYHLAHHVAPALPHYKLKALDAVLQSSIPDLPGKLGFTEAFYQFYHGKNELILADGKSLIVSDKVLASSIVQSSLNQPSPKAG